jgi:HEAT repeat protein/energy-coupling factor transporter ATP-binding protein EcfA2
LREKRKPLVLSGMAAEIEFDAYLRSISSHYDKWWQLYTLTDAQTKTQQEPSPFDFGLMVQTVQGDRPITSDASGLESQSFKEKIERFPVLEGIRKFVKEHRQVLLVGRPGSGKSTTLARLLLEEARAVGGTEEDPPNPLKKGEQEGAEDSGGASTHVERQVKVPLFKGDLGGSRGLGDSTSPIPVLVELRFLSNSTILDRIQAFFQRHDLLLDRTQIEDLLFHQRLLLLMDGLNELPSKEAKGAVAKFLYDHSNVSMVFTTRDLSLGGDFELEKKLEMQPLTEAQMQAFVRLYVPEQAEAMLRQLKDRLREFGQTPLLLWMLCGSFRQTGQIPANLGEGFRAFTQGYERKIVPVESDQRWWSELLQELAFWMMRGVPFGEEAPAVDVEFRAAVSKAEVRQIFTAFLKNKEAQAEGLALKYLDDLLRYHLIQSNGGQVEFQHQLLQEYYAAEALLKQLPKLDDTSLKQQYLNYLKWTEPVGLMLTLLQTETQTERVAKLASEVDAGLGFRLAGKLQPNLQEKKVASVEALKLPDWLETLYLKATRSEKAIARLLTLLKHSGFLVARSAAEALGEIGSEAAIPGLLTVLKHSDSDYDTRRLAAFALGIIGSETAISELLILLKHSNLPVVETAVKALGMIGSKEAIPELLQCLEHSDVLVHMNAAEALGMIGSKEAIPGLVQCLEHPNPDMRKRVAEALGKIGSESVIPGLRQCLKDSDSDVRQIAIDALVKIGSEATIPGLYQRLKGRVVIVRKNAAEALGNIGSEAAIPGLLQELEHSNFDRRMRAAEELGKIGTKAAIPELLQCLENSNFGVIRNFGMHRRAAEALVNIAKKHANAIAPHLPHLLNLIPTDSGEHAYQVILAIQENCKFYNYSITQTTQSMKLFFSYAHKDEPLRDELAKHLSLLKRQNIITDWHDRNITAGTDWAQAIDHNLNTADIILLLISSDFIHSEYCWTKEMDPALERHNQGTARVIPIILRPCDWHTAPFGKLQALPIAHGGGAEAVEEWGSQDKAFTNIAQGIRKAVEELQQSKNIQPNPNPAQPAASTPTQITYDLRGANIGNWAENQHGTQHTTQIQPNPSQPPQPPQ